MAQAGRDDAGAGVATWVAWWPTTATRPPAYATRPEHRTMLKVALDSTDNLLSNGPFPFESVN